MSIIIRLQNLPWSANSIDIRRFFNGLSIPDGGVHIVGGEMGDAFIIFSTDEDARLAMEKNGGKIKDMQIKLLLSSRTEMTRVIEQARQQNMVVKPPPQPAVSMQQPVRNSTPATEPDRRRGRSPSPHHRSRDRSPIRDRRRSPDDRRGSKRDRSRSPSRSSRNFRDTDRRGDRFKRDDRHYDNSRYRDDRRSSRDSSQEDKKYSDADSRPPLHSNESFRDVQSNYDPPTSLTMSGPFSYANQHSQQSVKSFPDSYTHPPTDSSSSFPQIERSVSQKSSETSHKTVDEQKNVSSTMYSRDQMAFHSQPFNQTTVSKESIVPTSSSSEVQKMPRKSRFEPEYEPPSTKPVFTPQPNNSILTNQNQHDQNSYTHRGPTTQNYSESRNDWQHEISQNKNEMWNDKRPPLLNPPSSKDSDFVQVVPMDLDPSPSDLTSENSVFHDNTASRGPPHGPQFTGNTASPRGSNSRNDLPNLPRHEDLQNQRFSMQDESQVHGPQMHQIQSHGLPMHGEIQSRGPSMHGEVQGRGLLMHGEVQGRGPPMHGEVQGRGPPMHGEVQGRGPPMHGEVQGRGPPMHGEVQVRKPPMHGDLQRQGPLMHNEVQGRGSPMHNEVQGRAPPMSSEGRGPLMHGEIQERGVRIPDEVQGCGPRGHSDVQGQPPQSFGDVQSRGPPSLTVEVRGLPPDARIDDILDIFRGITLPAANIRIEANDQGFERAFIRFVSLADFNEALNRNRHLMRDGRCELVPCPASAFETAGRYQKPKPKPKPREEDLVVMLRGLPFSCKDDDVVKFFDGLGILDLYVDIAPDGRASGIGYVEFGTPEDFRTALTMNGKTIGHRYITLSIASKEIMALAKGEEFVPMTHSVDPRNTPHPNNNRPFMPLLSNQGPVNKPPMNQARPPLNPPRQPHPPNPMRPSSTPHCIGMKNLPEGVTNRNIADFLNQVHIIPRAIHIMLRPDKTPSGDAYAEFLNIADMEAALELDGKDMLGNSVSVHPISFQEMSEILGRPIPMLPPLAQGGLLRTPFEGEQPRRPLLPQNPKEGPYRERPRMEAPVRGLRPRMDSFRKDGPPGRPPFGNQMRGPRPRNYNPEGRFPPPERGIKDFGSPGCVVSINNLHFKAGLEELLDFFHDYKLTKDNIIRKYNEKGQTTGEARVSFETPRDAQRAVQELNQKTIMGRTLFLSLL